MSILRQWKTKEILGLTRVIGASAALLVLAAPSLAESTAFHATFIEPYGGPHSPLRLPPRDVVRHRQRQHAGSRVHGRLLSGCGADCHLRVITFDDGSELLMNEYGNLADFASPGNSGAYGYIGFGLPGNPQVLQVTQKIVGGSGRFANVTGGSGAGTVGSPVGSQSSPLSGRSPFPDKRAREHRVAYAPGGHERRLLMARAVAKRGPQHSSAQPLHSLHVDSDVVEWFRAQRSGYQSRMHALLRAYVDAHRQSRKRAG